MTIGSNQLVKKGYGRIYVAHPSKIPRVLEILKEIDDYEFGSYYVNGLVTSFPEDGIPELIYTHKFEMCIDDITTRCWREDIWVWCITQRHEHFGDVKISIEAPSI